MRLIIKIRLLFEALFSKVFVILNCCHKVKSNFRDCAVRFKMAEMYFREGRFKQQSGKEYINEENDGG